VQATPDASPAKWHLAHTTWFFETFVLRDHVPRYRVFDPRFAYLFNSYYEAEGERIARDVRGLLIRPSLDTVLTYRFHVDAALLEALPSLPARARELVELGCNHEEQHQELLLMDLKDLLFRSPLQETRYLPSGPLTSTSHRTTGWIRGPRGAFDIGDHGDGFSFDSEGPRHTTWLHPHEVADRLVTNAEWQAFIDDGGYKTASLWLSDGWQWVRREGITCPKYWRIDGSGENWESFGLAGWWPVEPEQPVCHVSYYEADAYARWTDARLPTEAEWEAAASGIKADAGNFLDRVNPVQPVPASAAQGIQQLFGDVWEWTSSAFLPHPGFEPAKGAVGEYNGKFMSGQFVLKGGSCATPGDTSGQVTGTSFIPTSVGNSPASVWREMLHDYRNHPGKRRPDRYRQGVFRRRDIRIVTEAEGASAALVLRPQGL
jgi:ergothioneine biosynthesis protein EgtB